MKKILTLLNFLLCSLAGFTQMNEYYYRNFNIEQGLSQSSVGSMFQDSKTFLWFATGDGLTMYDGLKFKIFKSNPMDSTSLSDSWIFHILFEDSENNLWILTADKKINIFNLTNYKCKSISALKLNASSDRLHIFSIVEDKKKNVWLTTENAISCINLKSFEIKNYPIEKTETKDWMVIHRKQIFVDHNNNIWYGNQLGLKKYNFENNSFETLKHKIGTQPAYSMLLDSKKKMWVCSQNGLYCIENNSIKEFLFPEEIQIVTLSRKPFLEDKAGNIWIATVQGAIRFNMGSMKFFQYSNSQKKTKKITHNHCTNIYIDKENHTWIVTKNGVNKYLSDQDIFENYPIQNKVGEAEYLAGMIQDKAGEYWAFSMFTEQNIFNFFHLDKSDFALKSHSIKAQNTDRVLDANSPAIEDKTGTIWFGSYGSGATQYIPQRKRFYRLGSNNGKLNSLTSPMVFAINQDLQGRIWIGTYMQGLDCYDPKTGIVKNFLNDNNDKFQIECITSIGLKGNTLWITTIGEGLFEMDVISGKYKQYLHDPKDPKSISGDAIRTQMSAQDGKIWIGHSNTGVDIFDPNDKTFTHLPKYTEKQDGIKNLSIWAIFEDKQKNIWICTEGYVTRFNKEKNIFTHFISKNSKSQGILSETALCIYQTQDDNIWFGTAGGGLSKFDCKTERFQHWLQENGLPNEYIYGILEDADSRLWLSTNKGLSCFNPRSNTFTNYERSQGVLGNEFNSGAFYKDNEGIMYFGGTEGLTFFNPRKILPDTICPNAVINSLSINNSEVKIISHEQNQKKYWVHNGLIKVNDKYFTNKNLAYTDSIVLKYSENNFTIGFTAPGFDYPEKYIFKYKLSGFDDKWIVSNEIRMAHYTNIPFGDYEFIIYAANQDGVWSKKFDSLHISVLPPYYHTWWFRALVFLLLSTFFVYFVKYRYLLIRAENKKLEGKVTRRTFALNEKTQELILKNEIISKQKEELTEQAEKLKNELSLQNTHSEMALLRSQISPHFLFNTLNNIYSLVYHKSNEAPESMMKLSELMRYLVYDCSVEKVSLEKEIQFLRSYIDLQLLRLKDRNYVKFEVSGKGNCIQIPPMLLIPFVENAFKHACKNAVTPGIYINLQIEAKSLRFQVKNGLSLNGNEVKDKTGGIGLPNLKRRLELLYHNQHELKIENNGEFHHVSLVIDPVC